MYQDKAARSEQHRDEFVFDSAPSVAKRPHPSRGKSPQKLHPHCSTKTKKEAALAKNKCASTFEDILAIRALKLNKATEAPPEGASLGKLGRLYTAADTLGDGGETAAASLLQRRAALSSALSWRSGSVRELRSVLGVALSIFWCPICF